MLTNATVSINQANLFARGLTKLGYDPDPIFRSVGLSIPSENNPLERLSVDKLVALGKACETRTGDPGIGHKLYSRIRLGYLDSFGMSLLYSSDLMDLIRRFQKYLPYAVSRASIDIFEVHEGYYFACNWDLGLSQDDQQRITEWFSCAFVSMCEEARGEPFLIDKVLLEFSPSAGMSEMLDKHALVVESSHEQFGFILTQETVAKRLLLANPQMAQNAEELTLQYLDTLETEDIGLRVERKIVEGLATADFSKEAVAKSIGVSVRSLSAQLRQANTSYSQILERVRKERAFQYIQSDILHVSQIAYSLGFQRPSNFSRAFRSWTGLSPGEYRSQAAARS